MTQPRADIEAFVRRIAAEVRAANADGVKTHDGLAAHLNERGVTTRNGRPWNGATVEKFLSSPAAQRYLAGEQSE
jgi:Recombinase-like helix-turn-helix domain